MRIPPLSTRDRRALLLGVVLLGPLLAWGWGVRPYVQALAQVGEELAAERDLLRRELSLLGGAPEYPALFETGAQRLLGAAERLLGGEDDGAASAALTTYVQRLGGIAGVHLVRIEPLPPRESAGGLTAVPVRVSGEGDLEGFLSLVRLLEIGPKLAHVDRLQLQVAAGGAPGPAAGPETLSFQIEVTGFRFAGVAGTDTLPKEKD